MERKDGCGGNQKDEAAQNVVRSLRFSGCESGQACALESWIPFPTPGQWTEQIDSTLPALQITQNDQWTADEATTRWRWLRSCAIAQVRNMRQWEREADQFNQLGRSGQDCLEEKV